MPREAGRSGAVGVSGRVRVIREAADDEVYANVADLARVLEERGPQFAAVAQRIRDIGKVPGDWRHIVLMARPP